MPLKMTLTFFGICIHVHNISRIVRWFKNLNCSVKGGAWAPLITPFVEKYCVQDMSESDTAKFLTLNVTSCCLVLLLSL